VGIGSNQGDAENTVLEAIRVLRGLLSGVRASALYLTAPMYFENQDDFVNAVAVGETTLNVRNLLLQLKELERQFGRTAAVRYGPRVLDLDLLTYGSLIYVGFASPDQPMVVPHPKLAERRFVLEPLAEIDPNWTIPGLGVVAALANGQGVVGQQVRRLYHASI
jgi:2-amino-4-hydroxy-6-hydroxymethyldihydropteridine diphosphokinase